MEKLRQSVSKVETVKEKAAPKTDNLKSTLDSAEQEARPGREKAPQPPEGLTQEPFTTKSAQREPSGREQEVWLLLTVLKMNPTDMTTTTSI